MPIVAPNCFANSSSRRLRSTTIIGAAPELAQACTIDRPTPPPPKTATDCPARTWAEFRAAPAPAEHRAADDRGHVGGDVLVELDDHLLVDHRVLAPGVHPDIGGPAEGERVCRRR